VIVPADKLAGLAREIGAAIISASPTSIARTKRLLLSYDQRAIEAELELAVRENAGIRVTPDFREGVASFLEKRDPKWTGR
jgi:enoyl-CoA hydratase/carnithine racemase